MNIREIAKLAGVSVATISKVINQKDAGISAETREKVLRVVREHGYVPYDNLRVPVQGKTLLIGVLVRTTHKGGWLLNVLNQIHARGYNALVCAADTESERARGLHYLSAHPVDGLILEITDGAYDTGFTSSTALPSVTISYDGSSDAQFCVDYARLGEQGARLLVKAGHQRILCLTSDDSPAANHFTLGFQRRMATDGLPTEPYMCQRCGIETDLRPHLCSCSAVLCMTRAIAEAVLKQADRLHLTVPMDLSVLCLDTDSPEGGETSVSSLLPPFDALSRLAVDSLIDRLETLPAKKVALIPEAAFNHQQTLRPPMDRRSQKILVIGFINMDVMLSLNCPPRDGDTINATACVRMPGGKGLNQAVGAARLGAKVYLISRLGKDYDGNQIFDFLRANHVYPDGLIQNPTTQTGTAYLHVREDAETSIIGFTPESNTLCADDIRRMETLFTDVSFCLLQGMDNPDMMREAVETACRHGARVLLRPCDAPSLADEVLEKTDILLLSRNDLNRLLPEELSIAEKARIFLRRGARCVLVTLGHRGCTLYRGDTAQNFPAANVVPVDTTGATDAFASTLVVYLADGYTMEDAIRRATVSAGLSTTRRGVSAALVDRETIELFLGHEKPFLDNAEA